MIKVMLGSTYVVLNLPKHDEAVTGPTKKEWKQLSLTIH